MCVTYVTEEWLKSHFIIVDQQHAHQLIIQQSKTQEIQFTVTQEQQILTFERLKPAICVKVSNHKFISLLIVNHKIYKKKHKMVKKHIPDVLFLSDQLFKTQRY